MVERRLGLSLCRDLESFDSLEVSSLEDSREDAGGEGGRATGRYEDESCLPDRKQNEDMMRVTSSIKCSLAIARGARSLPLCGQQAASSFTMRYNT